MPSKPINYQKCVIYKIVCNDLNVTCCYVGHTTNFTQRQRHHKEACIYEKDKHHHYKVYEIIRANGGWDDWSMIEIEKYPCIDANEARARERYWYEELKPNLNSRLPFITKQEYLETHKEQKREYDKKYRENNETLLEKKRAYHLAHKDEINEKSRQYHHAHKDEINEKARQYHHAHKEEMNEKSKEYYHSHKEEKREQKNEKARQYHHAHKEEISKRRRELRLLNKQQAEANV